MTDFVVEMRENKVKDNIERFWACERYAKFLKQPLELWMFVPCDDNGNVLEKPKNLIWQKDDVCIMANGVIINNNEYINILHKAKERCLFEGFEFEKQKDYYIITLNGNGLWVSWNKSKKIENLIEFNLQLTPTALKEIGL
jgi:hypothetical protein